MEKSGALEPMDGRNDDGVDMKEKGNDVKEIRNETSYEKRENMFRFNVELVSYKKSDKTDENLEKIQDKIGDLMEMLLKERFINKYCCEEGKWLSFVEKNLLKLNCQVQGKKVMSMLSLESNMHQKALKKRIMTYLKINKLFFNLRSTTAINLKKIGFIAGAHGRIANNEWYERMLRKALSEDKYNVEVMKKPMYFKGFKTYRLEVFTDESDYSKVSKSLHEDTTGWLKKVNVNFMPMSKGCLKLKNLLDFLRNRTEEQAVLHAPFTGRKTRYNG